MSSSRLSRADLIAWLQIMGDHARFIKDSLQPGQSRLVLVASNFIQLFDRTLEKMRQGGDLAPAGNIIDDTVAAVISLREFKRGLLSHRLQNLPVTSLSPTFYNHMLNELEEFLKLLTVEAPEGHTKENIIGQHLLWTLDTAGHAAILAADLDKAEYGLRDEAIVFLTRFDQFYLEAVELAGYCRSNPPAVQSVLEAFNFQIVKVTQDFMGYLDELRQKVLKNCVLSRLSPLVPDHMYREECYYLHKIARQQPGLHKPECEPGRPRIKE